MSTTVDLAPASTTPKTYGPFTLTAADLIAATDYASGIPLFTPADGDFVAWGIVQVVTAWVGSLNYHVHDGTSSLPAPDLTADRAVDNFGAGIADGAQVRAYQDVTNAATSGSSKVWFIVFPASRA